MTMSARSLAQEVASWYLSQIDVYSAHRDNVRIFLRKPVVALTLSILQEGDKAADKDKKADGAKASAAAAAATTAAPKADATGGEANKTADWRGYLPKAGDMDFGEVDPKAFAGLSIRSKARMDAFVAGVALAAPASADAAAEHEDDNGRADSGKSKDDPLSLVQGLAGFKPPAPPKQSDILRAVSSGSAAISAKHPQIAEEELVTRLELYIRTLYRVLSQGQECVIAAEPARAMKARAQSVAVAFVETVSTVNQQGPILSRLITTLTMELLAVDVLSQQLKSVIRRLVSDYEHTTSFASLAFLSSPETAADQSLAPMVLKYLRSLQSNWKVCESECELERLLSQSLDPTMRHTFKTVEFQSIGHLLQVCESFRPQLQNVTLTPSAFAASEKALNDTVALHQAIRDLQREVITVNGSVLPPVTTRQDLVSLLSQTLNSRSLTDPPTRKKGSRRKGSRKTGLGAGVTVTGSQSATEPEDTDGGGYSTDDKSGAGVESDTPLSAGTDSLSRGVRRRRSFRLSTIDLLTRRLLLAGSRTGTGGDAFFVVRDLFGGEDVEVIPSQTLLAHGRAVRSGTIEILVKIASITIRCHGSFDVYPKSMVGDVEPLIQVHTTTSETISLQEVRASDVSKADGFAATTNFYDSDDVSEGPPMLLQERKTDKTGVRTLSIRPALYEKVAVWNTPS